MIVRKTKNSLVNISKLRTMVNNNNKNTIKTKERIVLINRYLKKVKFQRMLAKIFTLFLSSYKSEVIKLGKEVIQEDKKNLNNMKMKFEHFPSQTSFLLDKLIVLLNQLKKMKVYFKLDGTFFEFDQLDINDFSKDYFSIYYKKDSKIYFEDDLHIYEFNSLFVGMYDKKNNLLGMYSYDNIEIKFKDIIFNTPHKKNGLILKDVKWLYQLEDGSKDPKFDDNYQIYSYKLKIINIVFHGTTDQEFAILGDNIEKMEIFHSILVDYLKELEDTYFDVSESKSLKKFPSKKLVDYFLDNSDYSDIIFSILLEDDKELINISHIKKKYKLNNQDVVNIVNIIERFQLGQINLSLDIIKTYKVSEVKEMYEEYNNLRKQHLFIGDKDGQIN